MDYKEKYNKLVEAIKVLQEANPSDEGIQNWVEDNVPELAESEDERIRKEIYTYLFNELNNTKQLTPITDTFERWLKWLKYDEPKSVNNVKPKFKVGDWIVTPENKVLQITSIEDTTYSFNNESHYWEICYCDEKCHLWSIQDAKPGDVLAGKIDGDSYILIYKQTKDGWIETYGHYYNTVDRFCVPSQLFCRDYQGTFIPDTKEKRVLLFQKMEEAGYEWDVEKKELKKIGNKSIEWHREDEQNLNVCLGYIPDEFLRRWLTDAIHVKYDNPAWSEEDEEFLRRAINAAKDSYPMTAKWLKSLKQRIGG